MSTSNAVILCRTQYFHYEYHVCTHIVKLPPEIHMLGVRVCHVPLSLLNVTSYHKHNMCVCLCIIYYKRNPSGNQLFYYNYHTRADF